MVTIMWSLWKSHNLKLWQQQNESNSQVVQRETHLLDEWRATQIIRSRSHAQSNTVQVHSIRQYDERWKKPASGRYKCNIDAPFSTSLNRVGLRMCLRDEAGDFVLTRMDWFSPLCDTDVGEAVKLHTTLEWVSDLQFDNVDFALDSKKVVDFVNSHVDDDSELVVSYLLVNSY